MVIFVKAWCYIFATFLSRRTLCDMPSKIALTNRFPTFLNLEETESRPTVLKTRSEFSFYKTDWKTKSQSPNINENFWRHIFNGTKYCVPNFKFDAEKNNEKFLKITATNFRLWILQNLWKKLRDKSLRRKTDAWQNADLRKAVKVREKKSTTSF